MLSLGRPTLKKPLSAIPCNDIIEHWTSVEKTKKNETCFQKFLSGMVQRAETRVPKLTFTRAPILELAWSQGFCPIIVGDPSEVVGGGGGEISVLSLSAFGALVSTLGPRPVFCLAWLYLSKGVYFRHFFLSYCFSWISQVFIYKCTFHPFRKFFFSPLIKQNRCVKLW